MTAPKLLVVDDEPDLVRILITLARERGYEASGTVEPDDVLRHVRAMPPAVVLLDLHLPRIDGGDLLVQITAEPAAPAVIVMSGYVDAHTYEICQMHGAADVVRKPFDFDDLFRRIDAAAKLMVGR